MDERVYITEKENNHDEVHVSKRKKKSKLSDFKFEEEMRGVH